jgi:N-acetylneuraminic acid mutarotase
MGTATNLFYSVGLKTGRVEDLGEFPGGKVVLPAAAALGGRVYVFGGATFGSTNNPAVNVDSAWVYSVDEAKWSGLKPFPFPARGLASCVLDERHILLAGGFREDFTDEAFVYDTRTGNYSRTIPLPYRVMTCLIKSGVNLYCVGGEDKKQHRSELMFKIKWRELLEAARRP